MRSLGDFQDTITRLPKALIKSFANWPKLPSGNPSHARHPVTLGYFATEIELAKSFKNYFGSGADGALSTSGNVTITTSADGDYAIKNYTNLTINAGHTLTVSNRCKGLILFVSGNLVVNGTISMSSKGASAVGASVNIKRYQSGQVVGDSSVIAEEANMVGSVLSTFNIPAAGAAGAPTNPGAGGASGQAGTAGTNGQTGGGGSGGNEDGPTQKGGAGAAGTSFSGGGGGGGASPSASGGAAAANGGAGGIGRSSTLNRNSGGGAGNPGGASGGGSAEAGDSGTGGMIIIIVKGSVTIGASGSIVAHGANGGDGDISGSTGGAGGGGGSGGGTVLIAHGGTYTNNGTVAANGGAGGARSTGTNIGGAGGAGGAGSVQVKQVSNLQI